MKHDIRVTFHTDGQQPDSGKMFVESAIKRHPGVGAINTLKVEHHRDLSELLRRALPFVEEVCEADAAGDAEDNCGVRRAEAVRDEIYSILEKQSAGSSWHAHDAPERLKPLGE